MFAYTVVPRTLIARSGGFFIALLLFLLSLQPIPLQALAGNESYTPVVPADSLQKVKDSQKKLLETLYRNGQVTAAEFREITGEDPPAAHPDAIFTGWDLLDDDDDFGYTSTDTRVRRFRVRSEDGRDLFRLRGRLYIDGAALYLDDNKNTVDDSRPNRGNLSNYGTIIRSARIGAEGVMYEDFLWRTEIDFRDDEVRIRGAYLEYIRLNPFRIMVGHIKEPAGIEWMSSRNRSVFIERSPSNDAYLPDWNLGIRAEYRGSRFNLSGAMMSGGGIATNREENGGYAFAGRATVAPYISNQVYSHLGFAAAYRVNAFTERIDGNFYRQYSDVRLRTRLGTRAIDGRMIGADDIDDVVDMNRWHAEAALGLGPLSLQGEWTLLQVRRDFLKNDLDLGGFYVQASYFLTGERRIYRPSRGNFAATVPNRDFRPGFGPGAVELAVRYSRVDSNNHDYDGGEMDHFTVALNWYLNRETRIMLNYIYLDAERLNGKRSYGSVVALRVMFEF
ncbi:MAG: OprO/OprP family phosphate-selective porin [Balneolales bacterium]|nr:OprO/OprP family phosphate-selective porin [Balneolales bacterium]